MPKFTQEEREVLKNRAFELLVGGCSEQEVITRLNISSRTLRRWLKDEDVTFTTKQQAPEPEPDAPTVEVVPVPAVERIGTDVNRQQGNIEVTITSRTAVRLLRLAESAIAAVEHTLLNPDSSDISRIRAAEIAGRWTGLQTSGKSTPSILDTVSRKSAVSSKLTDSEAEIDLSPNMVENRREFRRREAEKARREAEKAQEIAIQLEVERVEREMMELAEYYSTAKPPFDYEKLEDYQEFNIYIFLQELDMYADAGSFETILEDLYRFEMVPEELYSNYKVLYSRTSVPKQGEQDRSND